MCRLYDAGKPGKCRFDWDAEAAAATGGARVDMPQGLPEGVTQAQANALAQMPRCVGLAGRHRLIKGGVVLSMDAAVGNFAEGDVLLEESRIVEVAAAIDAPGATVIDAAGKIVIPGFVDTHHRQFERALRSSRAHAIPINDGRPGNACNYDKTMLLNFSQRLAPQDVHINDLLGGISLLDAGVTTAMDVCQIHHSHEHSEAAIEGLRNAGRRGVFGYFEGCGEATKYPGGARRLKQTHFSSDDQMLTVVMGGEIYPPGYEEAQKVGRELGIPIALHVVGTLGMATPFKELARAGQFGSDNIFIHMTGMTDVAWKIAADAGAHLAPLANAAGAVVTLMERTNVDTVIVAGRIRKWQGQLLDHDTARLRRELEASRNRTLKASGIPHDRFAVQMPGQRRKARRHGTPPGTSSARTARAAARAAPGGSG